MQEHTNTPPQHPFAGVDATKADALARRRLLLRGLGKGAVVAAAAAPLHTLATIQTRGQTDGKNGTQVVWATVSGCQSAVGSRAPTGVPVSEGFCAGHYASKSAWPGYQAPPNKDQSICTVPFSSVYPGANSSNASKSCYTIVTQLPTASECRWVLAYLNAVTCVGTNYPYTQSELVSYYQNAGSNGNPTHAACEAFFGTYMESLS